MKNEVTEISCVGPKILNGVPIKQHVYTFEGKIHASMFQARTLSRPTFTSQCNGLAWGGGCLLAQPPSPSRYHLFFRGRYRFDFPIVHHPPNQHAPGHTHSAISIAVCLLCGFLLQQSAAKVGTVIEYAESATKVVAIVLLSGINRVNNPDRIDEFCACVRKCNPCSQQRVTSSNRTCCSRLLAPVPHKRRLYPTWSRRHQPPFHSGGGRGTSEQSSHSELRRSADRNNGEAADGGSILRVRGGVRESQRRQQAHQEGLWLVLLCAVLISRGAQ